MIGAELLTEMTMKVNEMHRIVSIDLGWASIVCVREKRLVSIDSEIHLVSHHSQ